MKNRIKYISVLMMILLLVYPTIIGITMNQYASYIPSEPAQILLYGEQHGSAAIYQEELALWEKYYAEQGMRDLFIEMPYYTTEYLNLWMQASDDTIMTVKTMFTGKMPWQRILLENTINWGIYLSWVSTVVRIQIQGK
ncbi:MAG: hypothetical protein PHP50_08200 [Lachnospiraceae bacterium]|nr:hypothetical protein [Lachnospiraceae bacterium]